MFLPLMPVSSSFAAARECVARIDDALFLIGRSIKIDMKLNGADTALQGAKAMVQKTA